ncbi:unnamed protein product [Schistosoma turkestanicum]|nr:unnamed protein product [Schistosoma turkestanicum]
MCILQKYFNIHEIMRYFDKFQLSYKKAIENPKYCFHDQPIKHCDSLEFINNHEMKVVENEKLHFSNDNNNNNNIGKMISTMSSSTPIRLFSCFPLNPNSLSVNNDNHNHNSLIDKHRTLNRNIEHVESLVMPCNAASPFLLSTINNSTAIMSTLPINTGQIEESTGIIGNTLHNLYSKDIRDISSVKDAYLTTISNNFLTSELDIKGNNALLTYGKVSSAFPQLCQHHERLLAQHYEQPVVEITKTTTTTTITTTTLTTIAETMKRNRNFGSVPRLKQTHTDFHTLFPSSIPRMLESTEQQTSHTLMMDDINTVQPQMITEAVCSQQYRSLAGQSTATAAVMAAAAAAVAAQASSLSKAVNSSITLDAFDLTNPTTSSPLLFVNEQKIIEPVTLNDNKFSDSKLSINHKVINIVHLE